jgi:hypothetical protein
MWWNEGMRRTDRENTSRNYFRTGDRVFSLNGQWFFATREGEVGPFRSREAAVKEASRYVREREDLARFQRDRERQLADGRSHDLALVPKDDRPELSLDDLLLAENRR